MYWTRRHLPTLSLFLKSCSHIVFLQLSSHSSNSVCSLLHSTTFFVYVGYHQPMLQFPGNCFHYYFVLLLRTNTKSNFVLFPLLLCCFPLLFLFTPCVYHTQLLFIKKLKQSSSLNISVFKSISNMYNLKTINPSPKVSDTSPRQRTISPEVCKSH